MTDIVKNVAANARPQINIKRKKIVKVQEGHTGAWKVAYADFVTTMMAFFMLMCLMNATTEKQKLAWQIISAPLYRLIGPFLVAITILRGRRFLSLSNLQKLGQGNRMPTKIRPRPTAQKGMSAKKAMPKTKNSRRSKK